jgi:hypothetical protein
MKTIPAQQCGYGNAINPVLAAEFILAIVDQWGHNLFV